MRASSRSVAPTLALILVAAVGASIVAACDDGSSPTGGLEFQPPPSTQFEGGPGETVVLPDAGPVVTDAGADAAVDTVAPQTTILTSPIAFSNSSAATFTFQADETSTFMCSVDGATPSPCTSPTNLSLPDGVHTFAVRATDSAGNQDDTPAEHVWTIDTVAPETTITNAPSAVDNSTAVSFEFTSDDPEASFACSIDGAAFAACTSPAAYTGLAAGAHTFGVRSTDKATNVDASPATHAWSIDTTTPDTRITAGPTGSVAVNTANFTFTSPNAGAGATYECSLDGGGYAGCTSPRALAGLGQGSHTFRVRVTNAAGTTDPTPAERTWTVDMTAPDTTINGGPTGTVASTTASFTFTSNEAGATFECSLDGAGYAACPAAHSLTGLGQGGHTLNVRAVDGAGNRDASPASRTWTVDTAAPKVSITAGPAQGGTSGPYLSFAFTTTEGSPECNLDGAGYSACVSPVTYSLAAGAHTFSVRAVDGVGNTGTATRNWTVECKGQTGGTGGFLLFPMDEDDAVVTLTNTFGIGAGTLGISTKPEVVDPLRISGRFGRALKFVAAERDFAQWVAPVAPAPVTFTNHTLEAWVRPGTLTTDQSVIHISDIDLGFTSTAAGVRFNYVITDVTGLSTTVSTGGMPAGTWYYIVATTTGTTMRIYVNGKQAASGALPQARTFSRTTTRIGERVDGDIDEVFVGDAAFDANTVLTRYCPL